MVLEASDEGICHCDSETAESQVRRDVSVKQLSAEMSTSQAARRRTHVAWASLPAVELCQQTDDKHHALRDMQDSHSTGETVTLAAVSYPLCSCLHSVTRSTVTL